MCPRLPASPLGGRAFSSGGAASFPSLTAYELRKQHERQFPEPSAVQNFEEPRSHAPQILDYAPSRYGRVPRWSWSRPAKYWKKDAGFFRSRLAHAGSSQSFNDSRVCEERRAFLTPSGASTPKRREALQSPSRRLCLGLPCARAALQARALLWHAAHTTPLLDAGTWAIPSRFLGRAQRVDERGARQFRRNICISRQ